MTGTASCNSRLIKQTTSARYSLAAEPSHQVEPAAAQNTKRTWIIAGAAVAALALAAFIGRQRVGAPEAVVAAQPPPQVVVQQVPEAHPAQDSPAPSAAEIRLIVSPASARLFVDNAPLPDNPYIGRFARNTISHQVRAEADGYVSRTELYTFDADRTIRIELLKSPAGAAAGAARVPAHVGRAAPATPARPRTIDVPSSSPVPDVGPAPVAKPPPASATGRDLDEANPYRGPGAPPKRIDETNPFR